jgi:hypothetical protein
VKAAADMVGLSTWTIRDLCDSDHIVSVYQGRRRLVDVDSLTAYIKGLPNARPAS